MRHDAILMIILSQVAVRTLNLCLFFALLVLLAELAADGDQLALVLLALLVHWLLKRQW